MDIRVINLSMETVVLIISLISIGISTATLLLLKRHEKFARKRRNEIDKTYGYLKFLDDANIRIYKEYLKGKNDRKPHKATKK